MRVCPHMRRPRKRKQRVYVRVHVARVHDKRVHVTYVESWGIMLSFMLENLYSNSKDEVAEAVIDPSARTGMESTVQAQMDQPARASTPSEIKKPVTHTISDTTLSMRVNPDEANGICAATAGAPKVKPTPASLKTATDFRIISSSAESDSR